MNTEKEIVLLGFFIDPKSDKLPILAVETRIYYCLKYIRSKQGYFVILKNGEILIEFTPYPMSIYPSLPKDEEEEIYNQSLQNALILFAKITGYIYLPSIKIINYFYKHDFRMKNADKPKKDATTIDIEQIETDYNYNPLQEEEKETKDKPKFQVSGKTQAVEKVVSTFHFIKNEQDPGYLGGVSQVLDYIMSAKGYVDYWSLYLEIFGQKDY
jgi:hypothetical protein